MWADDDRAVMLAPLLNLGASVHAPLAQIASPSAEASRESPL